MAGTPDGVLCHTVSSEAWYNAWINDTLVGESGILAAVAGCWDVPAIFVSGDEATCREVTALIRKAPNVFVDELERRVAQSAAAPWGVQLSAGFSRTRVLTSYAVLEKTYRSLLAGHDPAILRMVNRSRGTNAFYQVRVGAESREAASKLCVSLHAAGAACVVLRNPPGLRAM